MSDDTVRPGTPCWVDLATSDLEKSTAFYTALFGWQSTPPSPEFGGYVSFLLDGRPVAGLMRRQPGSPPGPDAWMTYLATDDVRATLAAVERLGGKVVLEAHPVGDLGVMGFLTDPSGAMVGLWQPGEHRGFDAARPVGAPVWHELHTRDHDAAVAFFARLFDQTAETVAPTADFRYTTLGERSGVMDASGFLPADALPFWTVYFHVADADAFARRVVALGGSMVQGPEDTPYGILAEATDATGARFKFMVPRP